MRIISGRYRGKNIPVEKKFKARPTTDFAKESLFNILNNTIRIEDLKVLDLFAGTGSISYEFASRGCEEVTAVEINAGYAAFIKKISEELSLNIKVVNYECFKYLKNCGQTFDLIFADPPYDINDIDKLPDLVFEKKLLKPDGIFILEHSQKYNFAGNKNLYLHKAYGSVNFSFFKN